MEWGWVSWRPSRNPTAGAMFWSYLVGISLDPVRGRDSSETEVDIYIYQYMYAYVYIYPEVGGRRGNNLHQETPSFPHEELENCQWSVNHV